MKTSLWFAASLCLAVAGCSDSQSGSSKPAERWDPANDPSHFSASFQHNVNSLPKAGQLAVKPWTDTYWPSFRGGIADRWQTESNAFSYSSPSLATLKTMPAQQIALLSPAEKYDIYMGRYDYPTVRSERQRTRPHAPEWEGICHGWAPAALNYKEPAPVTLKNSDGVQIPFGSADVKALLSYYQGQVSSGRTSFLAQRCDLDLNRNPGAARLPECRDTNAGSFHIVLANQIGLLKKGFVVDVTRDAEVWNQPVYAYRTQVDTTPRSPSLGAAPGTVKEYNVVTEMLYTVEAQPEWDAFGYNQNITSKVYQYRLELDANDNILGGEWLTEDRPDFMWSQDKSASFGGSFAGLNAIYAASTNGSPVIDPIPEPTVQPTAQPTPRPTVQPTPTPRPTAQPTAVPTHNPVDGNQSPYCPAGTSVYAVTGGYACLESNGIRVRGPFPQAMGDACYARYMAGYCRNNMPLEVYKEFRGTGRCPMGSSMDATGQACVDSSGFAYGPFSNALVSRCMHAGFGSSCQELVWNYGVITQLTE